MASDTAQVVRRKIPPPATTTTEAATAVQANTTTKPEEAEAAEQRSTAQVEKASAPADEELYYEDNTPSLIEGLNTLRSNIHDSMRMLADLAKESWNLPLSRDTVYAMGEINGQYNLILAFINRDIADAQAGQ